MGRMQKPKPVSLKKKKTDTGNSAPDGIQADHSEMPARQKTADPKSNREKAIFPAGRRTSEPTVLMKLIDRYFGKWIQFFREVKVELSRVNWPTRKETIGTTAVVIAFVIIVSLFLGLIDFSLSNLVRMVL